MSSESEARRGRPRDYSWMAGNPAPMRWYTDALDELRERVFDQVRDLPDEALEFAAPRSEITIGWLLAHLITGEAEWIRRLAGSELPAWLASEPTMNQLKPYGERQPHYGSAQSLIEFGRRVGADWTRVELAGMRPDSPTQDTRLRTVGEVLMHQIWHWSFHSGHIGLTRLQWGSEYIWTFREPQN